MGKWDRRYYARPRRRKYQDYQWSPPRDEPCPDPESEVWQDNVPMWEKKFCYLVGRLPWKKVLSSKSFMNCHSNVLSWDDSAGEEAFLMAKKRFWEEINGLSCDTQLPDPNMYIDEIDWNPYIDPDLVRELDQEYFNPDDKHRLPSTRSKQNFGGPDDVDVPWERGNVQDSTEENKASDWGQWDYSVKDAIKLNKNDPWESLHIHENGAVKVKATGWNQWANSASHMNKLSTDNNPWQNPPLQGNEAVKDNTWGGDWNKSWVSQPKQCSGMSKYWSADVNTWRKGGSGWQDHGASSTKWNQETGGKVPHTSYWSQTNRNRPKEYGSHRGSRMPNGRGNQWGQKLRDKYNWGPKDSINIHRDQGPFNAGCRKREGPNYYVANHKGPRLQGDGQPSYYWNRGDNRSGSFGGQ